MNECKPESDAAKCAASGFIHTKEWLKDTLPKFLRDSVPVSATDRQTHFSFRDAFTVTCPPG